MALDPVIFSDVRGEDRSFPPTRLPAGLVVSAENILLEKASLGRRRPQWVSIDTTSGPSSAIIYLVRHQPGVAEAGASGAELWAFANSASGGNTVHRRVNGAWSSVSVSDTSSSFETDRPHAATLNGKLFIAYNSDVNRLHVWDGTVMRRAGIAASAAPSVADTGSGSYAATIRYYKVQWKIKSGSNVIATSELSASQSFTPSGSGTAARVTKPTTPDSATHWVVFGSADNVTFYNISGDIAVGTTTYDDSDAPSNYSDGDVAPTAGLNVPPPSAKYLLAADNRLFMAGCHETSATSTQTATRNSRVWFTAVLGARDNTGEDEAITQTVSLRHWVDCGENDGDVIIGLAGPLDGIIYAFKRRSIWRLVPTGLVDAPYRADRVSHVVGARDQSSIVMGEDGNGNAAIYFAAPARAQFKRITSSAGMEDLIGMRLVVDPVLVWDTERRAVWATDREDTAIRAFQPEFESRTANGVIGGWTTHSFATGGVQGQRAACMYEVSSTHQVLVFGGGSTSGPGGSCVIGHLVSQLFGSGFTPSASDAGGAFTPKVVSAIYQPAGLLRKVRFDNAVLEWTAPGGAAAPTVAVASVIDGPTAVTGSTSDTATATAYTLQTTVQEKMESIQLSDVYGLQITVTWDTTVNGTEWPRINAVSVPVIAQEPA